MTALTRIDDGCGGEIFWLSTVFLKGTIKYFLHFLHKGIDFGIWHNHEPYNIKHNKPTIKLSGFLLGAGFEKISDGYITLTPAYGVTTNPLDISLPSIGNDKYSVVAMPILKIGKEHKIVRTNKNGIKDGGDGISVTLSKDNILAWINVLYMCAQYRLQQFQPYLSPQILLPVANNSHLHVPGYGSISMQQNGKPEPSIAHSFLDSYYLDLRTKYEILKNEGIIQLNDMTINPQKYCKIILEKDSKGCYTSCAFKTTPYEWSEIRRCIPNDKLSIINGLDVFHGSISEFEKIHSKIKSGLMNQYIRNDSSSPNKSTHSESYNPLTMITIKELCKEYKKLFGGTISERRVKLALTKNQVHSIYEKSGQGGFKAYSRVMALGVITESAKLE